MLLISLLLLPACSSRGGLSESTSLAVLFVACIMSGISTCILQSSCFAFFGTLPTLYVLGFVFGSGLSGPINSILRIIIAESLPSSFNGVKTGATIFFTIGMLLMFITVVIAFSLQYNHIVV
uniref:Major facilitator superfamily (MFS) profile domain-containing protein n=1 Tax=Lygus hesperus TaxID=30085 RepID=A0A0A9Z373_LYGHE